MQIGSEIRRLRKHSSRSAVGKFLKGVQQTPSYHVFTGIPSAFQVTSVVTSVHRPFHARITQFSIFGIPSGAYYPVLRRRGEPPSGGAGECW